MKKLPFGEETLPISDFLGILLKPSWFAQGLAGISVPSKKLLKERIKLRIKQGREGTIYRLQHELTPEDQLKHIEADDEIGKGLLEAERKLLEWQKYG